MEYGGLKLCARPSTSEPMLSDMHPEVGAARLCLLMHYSALKIYNDTLKLALDTTHMTQMDTEVSYSLESYKQTWDPCVIQRK